MTGHQREKQADLKNRFAGLFGQTEAPVKPAAAPARTAAPKRPRKAAQPATEAAPAPAVTPMPVTQPAADESRPKRLMCRCPSTKTKR